MTLYRNHLVVIVGLVLVGTCLATTASAQDAAAAPAVQEAAPAVLPQYADEAGLAAQGYPYGNVDVFHNYYPNTMAGVNSANMYPVPYPTPIIAGHTYYTYQPLYPHEYLYEHRRVYYNNYAGPEAFYQDPGRRGGACAAPGSGYNKTTVVWQAGPFAVNPMPVRILPLEGLRNAAGRLGGIGGCQSCR